jgi:hypothetical protein
MTSYVNPFTGQTIQPSQVGYEQLTISTDTILEWPVNGNTNDVVANIIELTATLNTNLKLIMPAATQVSTGQSVLIKNIGSYSFTVVKSDGSTIISIASGIAQYIYLTNNTTEPGTWSVVQFGAGTSSANASALAGYGLKAISTTLNQSYNIIDYYSNYSLTASDRAKFLVWKSGVGTFTLPSASTVGNDWFAMIRNNGTGILTVQPVGADTLDGNVNQQLQIGESFVIVSNGSTGFNTFGYGQSATFFFTQLALDVTGLGPTITLSSTQASNLIQEYFGTLAANTTVILPPTVQLYVITNLTSGAYTLKFSTGAVGAATVTIPQNQSLIVVCDGTNVYNANSATISVLPSLTLNPGSAASPSLNFVGNTTTGIYQPSTGQIGMSLNGVSKLTLQSDGLHVTDGIKGGTFS